MKRRRSRRSRRRRSRSRSRRIRTEFLKGATVRRHGRAKLFRDCARFWFLNSKMYN